MGRARAHLPHPFRHQLQRHPIELPLYLPWKMDLFKGGVEESYKLGRGGEGGGAHPPGMVRRSLSEPSAFVVVRGTTATSIVRGTSPEAPLPSSTSIGDGKGLPASPLKALPPGEGEGEGIQTNSDSVSWMGRRALYVTHMVRRSCRCHRQR